MTLTRPARIRPRAEVFGGVRAWLDGLGEGHPVFISDNPAFDFQWINHGFWHALVVRVTPHDHDPVNDAMGNVEAFETFQRLHREGRLR